MLAGIETCQVDIELNVSRFQHFSTEVKRHLDRSFPHQCLNLTSKSAFITDCVITDVWLKLEFGHHANG